MCVLNCGYLYFYEETFEINHLNFRIIIPLFHQYQHLVVVFVFTINFITLPLAKCLVVRETIIFVFFDLDRINDYNMYVTCTVFIHWMG